MDIYASMAFLLVMYGRAFMLFNDDTPLYVLALCEALILGKQLKFSRTASNLAETRISLDSLHHMPRARGVRAHGSLSVRV